MIQFLSLPISLLIIVLVVMKRVNYGLALLIGTVSLGILSGLSPQQFLDAFMTAFMDITTYDLALIISLIPILAYSMKETGMVDELIESVKRTLSSRAVLMFIPALMGALPMIGGALMSAPLIDKEADKLKLDGKEKSYINLWFRHWIYFIYPLYSPMILLAKLTDITIYSLISIQILPMFFYLLIGYLFAIRRIKDNKVKSEQRHSENLFSILVNISPILLVMLINLTIGVMVISLTIGIIYVFLVKKVMPLKIAFILKNGFNWKLPFAILGVMCFRNMVESSGAILAILPYIQATGLPIDILLIVISWIIGLTTAMPTAGIAIIVPIAMTFGKLNLILASTLYLTMNFAYLMSPLHLCMVLTLEHFKSRLQDVYQKLIPSALISYIFFLFTILFLHYIPL